MPPPLYPDVMIKTQQQVLFYCRTQSSLSSANDSMQSTDFEFDTQFEETQVSEDEEGT